uniref:Uncharacterized protein n=1 Tax=Chelonoidis abingdonii TaxID=106734 RepID=A0A8C0GTY2_CHEAB
VPYLFPRSRQQPASAEQGPARVPLCGRRLGSLAGRSLAAAGLQPQLDKFGGVTVHLAQLHAPDSLDQVTFQGWLQGKCISGPRGISTYRNHITTTNTTSNPVLTQTSHCLHWNYFLT